jgi:hypothetical protein
MMSAFNSIANTSTTNFVPVQATFNATGGFITFIGPGGVPFSTGGGSTFATDITVNGLTVGKGVWQTGFSSAFGFAALESPYGTLSNTGMTGIGYNTLNSFGVGIATVTVTNGGGGYYDNIGDTDTFSFSATLEYVSGPESTGVYPTATINVESGVVTSATITDAGYGFPDTGTTVFTAANPLGSGDGLRLSRNAFKSATNNTALGYNAGNTNYTGSNSVYLGYGANGTGSNEIVIGANATGLGDNSVVMGNLNITRTTLRGVINTTTYTVATLPAGQAGSRAFITDCTALTALFGTQPAGGSNVKVPVYHDGTSWKVG